MPNSALLPILSTLSCMKPCAESHGSFGLKQDSLLALLKSVSVGTVLANLGAKSRQHDENEIQCLDNVNPTEGQETKRIKAVTTTRITSATDAVHEKTNRELSILKC